MSLNVKQYLIAVLAGLFELSLVFV